MVLGHADARRDWGFTGDYVKAMCPVVQADTHEDLVIATGATRSMRGSCDEASTCVGLNSRRCVKPDRELLRPVDITETPGDASRAREFLGWAPRVALPELVRMMVDAEVERMAHGD